MIKWAIIALIGLIILGYLGFDIRKAVETSATQSNLEYAKEVIVYTWNKYLREPLKFIWTEVFIKYIWTPAIKKIDEKVKGIDEKEISTEHKVLFSYASGE